MEQPNPSSTAYIQRHKARINNKRLALENEHFRVLNEMEELTTKIKQLKRYYGYFKCRFVAYIKHLIQELQSAMLRARKRCEMVLQNLSVLTLHSRYPFL